MLQTMRTLLELGVWSALAMVLAGCSLDESCFENGVCPPADAAYSDVVGEVGAEVDVGAEVQMAVMEAGADSLPTNGADACSAELCSDASAEASSDASLDGATCTNTQIDMQDCGSCNNGCTGGAQCINGSCCGDGIVSGTEQCDPKGPGFNAFNCSPQCTKITSYTECGANYPPCLNGTVCNSTLRICTRTCSSTSDCDVIAGYPGLMIDCPIPKANYCVIDCTTNQDCPPGTYCNGGDVCVN
jgi:hypothetical protein